MVEARKPKIMTDMSLVAQTIKQYEIDHPQYAVTDEPIPDFDYTPLAKEECDFEKMI